MVIIDIRYKDRKIQKLCGNSRDAVKKYGKEVSERLSAALNYLENAESLKDIACLPTYRLHPLTGDRKDSYSMDLGRKTGYRLIITPDPPFSAEDEQLDLHSKCSIVQCIIILEVSNHYE